MRLRFGELSAKELAERQRCVQAASDAWSLLQRGSVQRACASMSAIDSRIALELDGGGAYVTAYEASAWPLAALLLEQAPRDLELPLSLGRPALPLEQALGEVLSRDGVALARASLRAGFGRGHLLELTLGVPGGSGAEIEHIAAENLVRALLGERLFDTWIGAVHATAAPRGGSLRVLDSRAPRSELRVDELFDTVAAAVRGVLLGLPEQPRASSSARTVADAGSDEPRPEQDGWTLLEVEPFADAPPDRKHDLLLASTSTPELLRCFLEGAPCSSRRFSRAGEQFVFVSYADGSAPAAERLARRAELETALAVTLEGVGAITGVGLGLHTTYLDVALCHPETGLACLVEKLRELGVPRHSFIQFFDSELTEEWLSIWPQSRLTGE